MTTRNSTKYESLSAEELQILADPKNLEIKTLFLPKKVYTESSDCKVIPIRNYNKPTMVYFFHLKQCPQCGIEVKENKCANFHELQKYLNFLKNGGYAKLREMALGQIPFETIFIIE